MHELPDPVMTELGRVIYFAGHADYYLGLFDPDSEGEQTSKGLSGSHLLKVLKPLGANEPRLRELLDSYEPMYVARNALVHGAHNWREGKLWTWHIPLPKKGAAEGVVYSESTLWALRQFADSWARMAEVAHDLFHDVFDADCRG